MLIACIDATGREEDRGRNVPALEPRVRVEKVVGEAIVKRDRDTWARWVATIEEVVDDTLERLNVIWGGQIVKMLNES